MTRNPLRLGLLSAALLCAPIRAEDPALRELLRDALYTEEVTRDPDAAAKQYEELLSRHDAQRAFAASALFRLAEVRRKQDRKDEAVALYQRLLREFPAATAETKLAAENLATLGAKIETPASAAADEEAVELKRLQQWVESSPDRLKDPELVLEAVKKGQLRSIEFLLNAGAVAEPWKLLREAVTTGNLRTTTLLLDYPFKSGYRGVDDALFTAVTLEYQDIAKLLLSRGADPHRQDWYKIDENVTPPSPNKAQMTALHVAVRKGNVGLCKLLLEHKADPNRFAEKPELPTNDYRLPNLPTGTPLHDAVVSSLEITRLLIEHGANVNAAPESTGVTPLHSAIRMSEPAEMIRFLIEKGANLEATTIGPAEPAARESIQPGQSGPNSPGLSSSTPLQVALLWGKVPAALQLLQAGASAKHPGILSTAVNTLDPGLVGQVLAKGALEAETDADPIRVLASTRLDASFTGAREKILDLLLQRGAKPQPAWIDQQFEGASFECLPLLSRRFLVPRLQENPAITLITPSMGFLNPIELATGTTGSPDSFANLLLQPTLRWALVRSPENRDLFPTRFTRWRKNTDVLHGSLDGSEALPDLQWGDVIELSLDLEKSDIKPGPSNLVYQDGLPPDILWHVRKRVSFPVTVEIVGKKQDVNLRGDRLVFDPTTREVPLTGARGVMALLWQPEIDLNELLWRGAIVDRVNAEVVIQRDGWPEVRIPFASSKEDFPLKAGDRISLAMPELKPEQKLELRNRRVTLKANNFPFARYFGEWTAMEGLRVGSVPTLMQALAEVTQLWFLREAPGEAEALPPFLISKKLTTLSFVQRPDFSRIRIRRPQEDGSEKVIPVDLAARIAASTEEDTPEKVRASDIELQAGDIVELAALPPNEGEPWTGLTAKEQNYFAKALDCRVQVSDSDGRLTLQEIRFQAPRMIDTAAGLVPLPPATGVASLSALAALKPPTGQGIVISRGDHPASSLDPYAIFLRQGDRLVMPPVPRQVPPPRGPVPQSPPQPGSNR